MRHLILAAANDLTALRVALLLRARHGVEQVGIRTLDEVLLAPCWQHELVDGVVDTRVRLHDGTTIASDVIFNRASWFDPPHFAQGSAVDRDYARMESFALLLSWLAAGGCAVLNRPAPSGLAGAVRRPLAWSALARRAGLDVLDVGATTSARRFRAPREVPRSDLCWANASDPGAPADAFGWSSAPRLGASVSALVVGERVFGDIAPSTKSSCRELARLAGLEIVRLDFAAGDRESCQPVFLAAELCPEVQAPAELIAIADHLDAASNRRGTSP